MALATLFSTDQRLLQVGDDAEFDRIVATDLRWVDIDVDQLRRRHVERVDAFPGAAVGFAEARAERQDVVGAAATVVDVLRAPESRHSQRQWMVVRQCALAHQRMRDRDAEVVDEVAQLLRSIGEQNAAADVQQWFAGARQQRDDAPRRRVIDRRLLIGQRVCLDAFEQSRIDLRGENIHRHGDQYRPGPAALGEMKRLVDDLREQVRPIDTPGAFHKRTIDLILRSVRMQVHFLMRVLAVVVTRHIAGNDDHRNGIERCVGDARRRVRQPRPEVAQHDARLASSPAHSRRQRVPRSVRDAYSRTGSSFSPAPRAQRCWYARTARRCVRRRDLRDA